MLGQLRLAAEPCAFRQCAAFVGLLQDQVPFKLGDSAKPQHQLAMQRRGSAQVSARDLNFAPAVDTTVCIHMK